MTALCAHTYVFSIPARGSRVPEARRTILTVLTQWGLPTRSDKADAIAVVASELITNAVDHAGTITPNIAIVIQEGTDGLFRLGVRDRHPGRLRLRARTRTGLPTSGRGLAIVQALLTECGGRSRVERHEDGGKTVWAEIPFGTPSTAAPSPERIRSRSNAGSHSSNAERHPENPRTIGSRSDRYGLCRP